MPTNGEEAKPTGVAAKKNEPQTPVAVSSAPANTNTNTPNNTNNNGNNNNNGNQRPGNNPNRGPPNQANNRGNPNGNQAPNNRQGAGNQHKPGNYQSNNRNPNTMSRGNILFDFSSVYHFAYIGGFKEAVTKIRIRIETTKLDPTRTTNKNRTTEINRRQNTRVKMGMGVVTKMGLIRGIDLAVITVRQYPRPVSRQRTNNPCPKRNSPVDVGCLLGICPRIYPSASSRSFFQSMARLASAL